MINAILGTITIIVIASVCWCIILAVKIFEYFMEGDDDADHFQ